MCRANALREAWLNGDVAARLVNLGLHNAVEEDLNSIA
jgi:hypothetical protein